MDTVQIYSALSSNKYTKPYLRGIFPINKIPKIIKKKPAILVINTDKSNQPGTHWVAIYLPRRGCAEFFDSFGRKPESCEFLRFLQKHTTKKTNFRYNKIMLQNLFTSVCGQYCCMYLLYRCKNKTLKDFQNCFRKNDNSANAGKLKREYHAQNDEKIVKMFNKEFKRK